MNKADLSGRLLWLSQALTTQRHNLSSVLARLKEIGVRAGTSLGLHRKFIKLMEQIAVDREKELDIIGEIEAVEKRHQELRQRKMLRQATLDIEPDPACMTETAPDKEPERMGILTLFGLIYLFSSKPINHKNQSLTVD